MFARSPRVFIATASVGAVLAAGCGDDGAEPLPREEFVARAESICEEGNKARRDLGGAEGNEAIDEYRRRVQEIRDRSLERLEGLEPPEDMQAAYEEMLETAKEMTEEPERERELFPRFQSLAQELELERCAGPNQA